MAVSESRLSSDAGQSLVCFYDAACPLCSREVRWLERRDGNGSIGFVDISAPDFDPEAVGKTLAELEGSLHVRRSDGGFVQGTEAFRELYRAIGLGWLAAPSGWWGLRPIFDAFYWLFARIRPLLPGRRAPDVCDATCRPRSS